MQNRTIHIGDNLPVLKSIKNESIDLIATDPPFNKGRDFSATPESLSDGASFKDRWIWERDIDHTYYDFIHNYGGGMFIQDYIWFVKRAHSYSMGTYLAYLAPRIFEMWRVLTREGALYLHCDWTANSYIRVLLDTIFGEENYRNEIKWCYTTAGNVKRWFPRKSDSIFYYVKSQKAGFNLDDVRVPYAPGLSVGGKTAWGYKETDLSKRLEKGKLVEDYWTDIPVIFRGKNREKTGYPTQKPLALYERIIKASSNAGDVVLDPFCGCGTTLVAAERLGRQWMGIDLWAKSSDVLQARLRSEGFSDEIVRR